MASKLIITKAENLQSKIYSAISVYKKEWVIYISLNKSTKTLMRNLNEKKISMKQFFFVDCVTQNKFDNSVLYIHPTNLDHLSTCIKSYLKYINGKKILVVDSLATLLIYNSDKQVARFVEEIASFAANEDVVTIAFSPKTRGEELLNTIFNFFDKVVKR